MDRPHHTVQTSLNLPSTGVVPLVGTVNTYIPVSFPYPGELCRVKEGSDIRYKPAWWCWAGGIGVVRKRQR